MFPLQVNARAAFLFFFFFAPSAVPAFGGDKTAILVDKKTNTLRVVKYVNGAYEPVKSFHATLGKVTGDKVSEGDLKTPEGIYTFKSRLTPPTLKPKFGKMAFYLNFPNDFDRIAGYTGSDIMLHATNEPERLKQNYDSEGCIVVNNEEITEIQPWVRVGLTPILVFDELKDEFLKPGQSVELKAFFDSWIQAWETKDVDSYISHYHSDFSAQGMNKDQWKSFKGNLNARYKTIAIGPEDVQYYRHPKYSMITFTQNYRSTLKNGGVGHRSRGTKILTIAEEAAKPRIISEAYTTLMW
ncbi:MAG: L,D-transpeptidase family protein [Oligoflexia bacterium]|nr:L,D-transpeptidase family protein [Oligoflexia bacterium]